MIHPSENVARAIFSPKMILKGEIQPEAFRLRSSICENYLSVMRMSFPSWVEDIKRIPQRKNRKLYGFAEMNVGEIRDIRLKDVVYDVSSLIVVFNKIRSMLAKEAMTSELYEEYFRGNAAEKQVDLSNVIMLIYLPLTDTSIVIRLDMDKKEYFADIYLECILKGLKSTQCWDPRCIYLYNARIKRNKLCISNLCRHQFDLFAYLKDAKNANITYQYLVAAYHDLFLELLEELHNKYSIVYYTIHKLEEPGEHAHE